ncbi:MAG: bifunctional diaminohydroxyphosphoribosylaminopyrimidine deaminase/5-amino-6-(5-phosphoribosylamino)uracil reductase RibD [Gammaproteobacteria bacterium]|nr:bifunctional diaminohydroxyphosphoribosylaminopyrimidine deaminase/5-amino-6-(5-phosphoribosylamino)uracil reductase RibD [Gammaproteobacteria bacterium]
MTEANDTRHMARALQLAAYGLYTTDPNPRVGCVLVKDGTVIGEGWHARAGEPHAEVLALRAAGEAARSATAYVSLEPCAHHGRTPPCAEVLIAAGVSRVVVAMEDPNPQVIGQGLQMLREAGIATESGLLQSQAEALNPGFIKRMRTGRPFVRCKLAMSLDGRTAMASGESQWITGAAARADVHRLRARSSAMLTGIGTVLADDPLLNVRLDTDETVHQPLRVVLDSRLRMPVDARMLSLPGRTLVCCTEATDVEKIVTLTDAGAEVHCLPVENGHVSLVVLLDFLAGEGVNEVTVEAGATLNGALLQAGLVDEIIVYLAPLLMGDAARGLFHLPGLEKMDQRIKLQIVDVRAVGDDWRITAQPFRGTCQ